MFRGKSGSPSNLAKHSKSLALRPVLQGSGEYLVMPTSQTEHVARMFRLWVIVEVQL